MTSSTKTKTRSSKVTQHTNLKEKGLQHANSMMEPPSEKDFGDSDSEKIQTLDTGRISDDDSSYQLPTLPLDN